MAVVGLDDSGGLTAQFDQLSLRVVICLALFYFVRWTLNSQKEYFILTSLYTLSRVLVLLLCAHCWWLHLYLLFLEY